MNESSDEEDFIESEDEEEGTTSHGDAEKGQKRFIFCCFFIFTFLSNRSSRRPPTDEIVPVFRRDCHLQVHAGSHQYPGSGIYLLKFDNSYSLWRSKARGLILFAHFSYFVFLRPDP